MYALILDDSAPPRRAARARVDAALERPFDEEEALEYDAEVQREQWEAQAARETQGDDAIAQAAQRDQMFGAVSYG